ncbi:MAG: hypothetical protein KJO69_07570 [Gammaproteobacteria bacterium]|nr:hypothetical protein [Gammaproteobacteria bacterium]
MNILLDILHALMIALGVLIIGLILFGCDMPDVPDGATCSPDGWVMTMAEGSDPLDWTTWEFVIDKDDDGGAMQCVFN